MVIPVIAPTSLILLVKIPRTIGGNSDDAANPNASATTSATNPGGLIPRYPAIHIAVAAKFLLKQFRSIRNLRSESFSDHIVRNS